MSHKRRVSVSLTREQWCYILAALAYLREEFPADTEEYDRSIRQIINDILARDAVGEE